MMNCMKQITNLCEILDFKGIFCAKNGGFSYPLDVSGTVEARVTFLVHIHFLF